MEKVATPKMPVVEKILHQTDNRFVLFPIQYQQIWDMYKTHVKSFWVAEEIDLQQDLTDWQKLNPNEQHFIKHV
jgi:ribonucleotide reductase beta subunit family protein with ferritin-like domain